GVSHTCSLRLGLRGSGQNHTPGHRFCQAGERFLTLSLLACDGFPDRLWQKFVQPRAICLHNLNWGLGYCATKGAFWLEIDGCCANNPDDWKSRGQGIPLNVLSIAPASAEGGRAFFGCRQAGLVFAFQINSNGISGLIAAGPLSYAGH